MKKVPIVDMIHRPAIVWNSIILISTNKLIHGVIKKEIIVENGFIWLYHKEKSEIFPSWNVKEYSQEQVQLIMNESSGWIWDFKIIDIRKSPEIQDKNKQC